MYNFCSRYFLKNGCWHCGDTKNIHVLPVSVWELKNHHNVGDKLHHEISVSSLLAMPSLTSLVRGCLYTDEGDLWRWSQDRDSLKAISGMGQQRMLYIIQQSPQISWESRLLEFCYYLREGYQNLLHREDVLQCKRRKDQKSLTDVNFRLTNGNVKNKGKMWPTGELI